MAVWISRILVLHLESCSDDHIYFQTKKMDLRVALIDSEMFCSIYNVRSICKEPNTG